MRTHAFARFGLLLAILMLGACSSTPKEAVSVPNTQPGDQLQAEYMVGQWCTNREETSQRNKDANFSALTNLSQQYWRLDDEGEWGMAGSGWYFKRHGSWRLEGRDSLLLARDGGEVKRYRAQFINDGSDLVLQSESGDFLVMERCD
jgi:hypothetical protein